MQGAACVGGAEAGRGGLGCVIGGEPGPGPKGGPAGLEGEIGARRGVRLWQADSRRHRETQPPWSHSRPGEGSSRDCEERSRGCKCVGEKVRLGEVLCVGDLFGVQPWSQDGLPGKDWEAHSAPANTGI